jgi:hypothetical protein
MVWGLALILFVPVAVVIWRVIQIRRETERQWENLDANGIHRGLEMLLKRGYDGGFAIVTEQGIDRFLQFRKYIRAPGDFGIHMHFPRTTWSELFQAAIRRRFAK